MKKTPLLIAVVGLIAATLPLAVAAPDAIRVGGTRVSLHPPAGFIAADRFPGFQNATEQASIMVSEFPAPVAELIKGMTKDALATKGMELLASTRETVGGHSATLLHVAQQAGGREFVKWMLVGGDEKASVMVVGTFPKGAPTKVGDAIRTAILSTQWTAPSTSDPFDGLAFRIEPSPKLKVAGQMTGMLILTQSGRLGTAGPNDALYVVGRSINEVPISNLAAFSEARAKATVKIQDLRNFRGKDSQLDGLKAYELEIDAKDAKTGTAMRLYQVIAPENDGYFIIQGLISAAEAPAFIGEFRKLTKSFRRTNRGGADRPTNREQLALHQRRGRAPHLRSALSRIWPAPRDSKKRLLFLSNALQHPPAFAFSPRAWSAKMRAAEPSPCGSAAARWEALMS